LAAAGVVGGLYPQAEAVAVKAAAVNEAPVDVPAVEAPAGNEAQAARGHALFNANCSHCHGPDAASPERRSDLRRLLRKYSDTVNEVFAATVLNGRPEKGMPPWKDILSEADIASIKAYVDTVQQSR